MKIYLVRHTSVNSDPKICYGWTDVDVSEKFIVEADRIKEIIPDENFVCYSSDLKRCVKLAKYLADEIQLDSGLREMNFGDWEGQEWSEIEKTFADEEPADFVEKQTPNGESYREQQKRVLKSWDQIINKNEDKIVVVAHGGSIRIILCELLGMQLEKAFRIKIDYGSVSEITINDDYITVDKINS